MKFLYLKRNCIVPKLIALILILTGCSSTLQESGPVGGNPQKSAAERGKEIVAEYLKRDSSPYRKTRVRLTVEGAEGKKKVYVIKKQRKQSGDETLSITKIVEPIEDSDLATLTIQKKGEPSVNVTWVASQNRFREAGTNKMFFGGITSQELLGEWDKYEPKFLAEKQLNGVKVFEIEATLKSRRSSVIARTVTMFGAEDYLPRKVHLFNSDEKEIRTFFVEEIREFSGKKVTSKTRIKNHIYNSTVFIEVLNMSFPEEIPDSEFTREYLKKISR